MASIAKFDEWQTTAGIPRETVLQVKQTHLRDRYTQSMGASVATDVTDLNVTIVPSSINSRILLFGRWTGEYGSQDRSWNSVWGFKRSGTRIGDHNNPGSTLIYGMGYSSLTYYADDSNSTGDSMTIFYVDSPATTSSLTYSIYNLPQSAYTLYTNRVVGWSGQATDYELTTSTIIAMEISA